MVKVFPTFGVKYLRALVGIVRKPEGLTDESTAGRMHGRTNGQGQLLCRGLSIVTLKFSNIRYIVIEWIGLCNVTHQRMKIFVNFHDFVLIRKS